MNDISSIVVSLFSNIWSLFSGVKIPGLNMSAAQLLIGMVVLGFSLRLIGFLTGFNTSGDNGVSINKNRERLYAYRSAKRAKFDE